MICEIYHKSEMREMNHLERKKLLSIETSRGNWKQRAVKKTAKSREQMFRNRDLVRSREGWKHKVENLVAEIHANKERADHLESENALLQEELKKAREASLTIAEKKLQHFRADYVCDDFSQSLQSFLPGDS
jgi:hypothetical protein